ncbi:MAG: inositol monophosphatase [Candidatus Omnitrophica bacterium]|nr:inositol monophosphatase [Candidatus Omnitrophota bacterium]
MRTAVRAGVAAGRLILESYGKLKNSQIKVKTKNDFVTEIDKKSEELIISAIRKRFPGHAFQAEESGCGGASSDALWVIDPLDGTANYIHQFPMFSVSIALVLNGKLTVGTVVDPVHGEVFTAERGKGAFLNKKRIRVSGVKRLADAMMATGIPFRARGRFHEYMASFEKISRRSAGMRRGGSAALDLAYVASGRFDGFWEINLAAWDMAAGALLIREAGGRVSDLWGGDGFLKNGDVLASNGFIHRELETITLNFLRPKP